MQFRTTDYNMEQCRLHIRIPQPTKRLQPEVSILEGVSIDIWELDMNEGQLSLQSMYPLHRSGFLDEVAFDDPYLEYTNWTSKEFDCAARTYPTFEVSLNEKSEGWVDWWQDREGPNGK